TLAQLRTLAPDVIVIATFHNILRRPAIETAGIAALNVHPSFLPALRGADPINLALQQHAAQTGVTIHLVDEGIDTGDIVVQQAVPIPPRASEKTLRPRLAELAGSLLIQCLDEIARGGVSTRRQASL
ncbi:MAG: methionyl-tRNA formyltransferase, partial [Betaproteobacteria bacterium]